MWMRTTGLQNSLLGIFWEFFAIFYESSDKFWGLRAQPFPKFGQISGPWPPQNSDKSSDPSKIRKRPLGLLSGVLPSLRGTPHACVCSKSAEATLRSHGQRCVGFECACGNVHANG